MGSISTSLLNSTGALEVYGRVFNTLQNNITNAHTPGYARQEQTQFAASGGGVLLGSLLSTRSLYAEQAVHRAQERYGASQQKAADLSQIESLFDVSGKSGVPGAISEFFNSVSQWSVNPSHQVSRQAVLDAADDVAQSFQLTAQGIANVSAQANSKIRNAVAGANQFIEQIADINRQIRAGDPTQVDPGLEARVYAALEELSAVIPFSLVKTTDGNFSLYLAGQKPLVVGDHVFPLNADVSSAQAAIRDSDGNDLTPAFSGQSGSLGALLEEKNATLPGYLSQLNTLAQGFADSVNTALAGGLDQNGNTPVTNLFSYNAGLGAAYTLTANSLTPAELAGAAAGAPGGNGNALAIVDLAQQTLVNGSTFADAFGNLGGTVGRDLAQAKLQNATGEDLLNQARAQRNQISGVSLDAEAAKLIQYQQSYQAVTQYITIMRSLTETVLQMVR